MTDKLIYLTADEQLLCAALIRLMVRQDGILSTAEDAAIDWVSQEVAVEADERGSPYREAEGEPMGPARLRALIDEAGESLPDENSLREAVNRLDRPDAQESIYGLIFEIAASDVVQASEWTMLEWLADAWNLRPNDAD